MSDFSSLINSLTGFAWPLLAAGAFLILLPAIRKIMESRGFSIKIGGAEITVQDATDQIRAQIADLQKQVIDLREITKTVPGEAVGLRIVAQADRKPRPAPRRRAILWVDDNPSNNAFEMAHLQDEQIEVVQALDTSSAMARLGQDQGFAAVVSDMGRREDGKYQSRAGIALLKAMRGAQYQHPFMIYTSARNAAASNKEVKELGGAGATASAVELLEWIDPQLGS